MLVSRGVLNTPLSMHMSTEQFCVHLCIVHHGYMTWLNTGPLSVHNEKCSSWYRCWATGYREIVSTEWETAQLSFTMMMMMMTTTTMMTMTMMTMMMMMMMMTRWRNEMLKMTTLYLHATHGPEEEAGGIRLKVSRDSKSWCLPIPC